MSPITSNNATMQCYPNVDQLPCFIILMTVSEMDVVDPYNNVRTTFLVSIYFVFSPKERKKYRFRIFHFILECLIGA